MLSVIKLRISRNNRHLWRNEKPENETFYEQSAYLKKWQKYRLLHYLNWMEINYVINKVYG